MTTEARRSGRPPADATDAPPRSVAEQEVLEALARQARRVSVPVVLAALMIVATVGEAVPAWLAALWGVAVAGLQLLRITLLPVLAADVGRPVEQRLAVASRISLANGCLVGSCAARWRSRGSTSGSVRSSR